MWTNSFAYYDSPNKAVFNNTLSRITLYYKLWQYKYYVILSNIT